MPMITAVHHAIWEMIALPMNRARGPLRQGLEAHLARESGEVHRPAGECDAVEREHQHGTQLDERRRRARSGWSRAPLASRPISPAQIGSFSVRSTWRRSRTERHSVIQRMPYHSTMSTAPNPTMSEARCTKSAIACSRRRDDEGAEPDGCRPAGGDRDVGHRTPASPVPLLGLEGHRHGFSAGLSLRCVTHARHLWSAVRLPNAGEVGGAAEWVAWTQRARLHVTHRCRRG